MICLHSLGNRFPCGQCMACRINKQAEKALRISHELQYHKDNVFVTLTYAPENLPEHGSLVKRDVQLFMKKVRKYLGDDRVRYYLSGEYGSEEYTQHPHYHIILFGVGMRDDRLFSDLHYVPSKDTWYCKCKAWKDGFVSVAPVNDARVSYVAKYLLKKITGEVAREYYGERVPEFSLCSRNPGIGYQYAIDHQARMKADDCCKVRGKKHPIPRYYIDKLYSNVEKSRRSIDRSERLEELREKDHSIFNQIGALAFVQLKKDRQDARVLRLGQKIKGKVGTKCPVK